MADSNNGAMVPASTAVKPAPAGLPAFLSPDNGPDYWTDLKPSNPLEADLIFQMRQGQSLSLLDHINTPLAVVHILAHPVQVETEQGELKDLVRLVFMTQESMFYSCASAGVKDSLNLIFSLRGLPPYNPPLLLKAVQRTTKKNRRLLQLELVRPTGAKK